MAKRAVKTKKVRKSKKVKKSNVGTYDNSNLSPNSIVVGNTNQSINANMPIPNTYISDTRERDVTQEGEINLHSSSAVNDINNLIGTPVDDKSPPIPGIQIQPAPETPTQEVPAPAPGVKRILIVVPVLSISYEFFKSFLAFWHQIMLRERDGKSRYEVGYHFIYRKPVHLAEIEGVNVAKHNKCTHILFMDDDIYDVTPKMLDKLVDADKDVISGVMYASGFPYAMCTFRRFNTETTVCSQPVQKGMYRLYEIPCYCPYCFHEQKIVTLQSWDAKFCPICRRDLPADFAVQPVDLIPFPFTLMKLSVFDRIRKPWFHCTTVFPTDSWFADRCIEAGIQQYAHMLVRLNHRGINDVTRPHRFNEGMALSQQKGGTVQITPEQINLHQRIMEEKLEMAEEKLKRNIRPNFNKEVGK